MNVHASSSANTMPALTEHPTRHDLSDVRYSRANLDAYGTCTSQNGLAWPAVYCSPYSFTQSQSHFPYRLHLIDSRGALLWYGASFTMWVSSSREIHRKRGGTPEQRLEVGLTLLRVRSHTSRTMPSAPSPALLSSDTARLEHVAASRRSRRCLNAGCGRDAV